VKQGFILGYEAEIGTYLNELDVRKPLVESILQISEQLRLYKLVLSLTISNPGLKAVSSNASPGGIVRFLGGDDRSFFERGRQDLSKGTNVAS
jgi:hypothetical protein